VEPPITAKVVGIITGAGRELKGWEAAMWTSLTTGNDEGLISHRWGEWDPSRATFAH